MKKIVHHLRKKPLGTRIQILNLLTLVAGIILILIWIWSIKLNVSNNNLNKDISEIKKGLEPISSLKDNFLEGYNSLEGE